jgi:uncharacterized protein YndB with AHSA1/START domain
MTDDMPKNKYLAEFEINASKKMLYSYIQTASGLAQWIAEDVTVNEDNVYNFIWDGEDHKAKMVSHRTNNFVKFEYLSENEDEEDPSYFEIRIEMNELTQSVFLRITDYTDFDDEEEWFDLWDGMVHTLKETVGG